jgi:hypothetical protein
VFSVQGTKQLSKVPFRCRSSTSGECVIWNKLSFEIFEVFLLTPFWWVKLGWGFWRCFTQAVH